MTPLVKYGPPVEVATVMEGDSVWVAEMVILTPEM